MALKLGYKLLVTWVSICFLKLKQLCPYLRNIKSQVFYMSRWNHYGLLSLEKKKCDAVRSDIPHLILMVFQSIKFWLYSGFPNKSEWEC